MDTTNEANNEKRGISWHDWQERNRLQDLHGVALRAKLTKWASIAALLLAVVFWNRAADYQAVLGFVVCVGAVRVAFLAGAVRRYDWASLFIGIALLYNPVYPPFALVPPFALAGRVAFLLVIATIAAFALSLLLPKPRLTPAVAGD